MSSFNLKIVTPDKLFFDGTCDKVIVRTTEGDVGILKNHTNYIAALDIGPMKIYVNNNPRGAALSDGFIKVTRQETVILAGTCEWADEIDVNRAQKSKEKAQKRLSKKLSDNEEKLANAKLKKAINRISIAQK